MNIDSSSILSLLSSDKSLENLQQTIQLDNGITQDFADTFLEKIKQLNGQNKGEYLADNFTVKSPDNTNQLHEIADLLNEKSTSFGFSSLFGKDLPKSNKLENDIDLENTLASLANVMLTLEEVKFNGDEIQTQLSTLVENAEALKSSVPEQIDLGKKLSQLVQELQALKKDISKSLENNIASHVQEIDMEVKDISIKLSNEDLIKGTSNPNTDKELFAFEKPVLNTSEQVISIKVQNEKTFNIKQTVVNSGDSLTNNISHISNQQPPEKGLLLSDKLTTRIDKVVATLKQIEVTLSEDDTFVDIESQIELLTTDINIIRETLNQNSPVTLTESKLNKDLTSRLSETEIKDEALQRANQIKEIATPLTPSLKQENIVAETKLVGQLFQQENHEIKKELFSLKQMAEERSLNFSTKGQTETLLHQESSFPKPVIDKPVISTIQNEKVELVEVDDLNQNHEKGGLKFVNDVSNLNKSILFENKVEIPPMNKHFAHPDWNKEFGERIIWMHKQSTPSAELRLNPKHLGPITIKLDVTQDQATIAFTAQHAAVKEAIDAAIPKLREMLSAQQLNLVEVNVSQENLDQRHSRGYAQMWGEQGKSKDQDAENLTEKEQTNTASEIVDEIESGRAIASNGLLSIFA